ncbi:MAG: AAA+ ATPase superfamily predicted ATPase [Myxococcota bacterium]
MIKADDDRERMENSVGRPVRGGNFFDREDEQRRIWRRLETDHILMLAPRRVGKTSLLLRLADDAGSHGYHATYFSVADAQREVDFVKKMIDALSLTPAASSAIRKVSKGPLKRLFRHTRRIDAGPVSLEFDAGHEEAESQWSVLGETVAKALERVGGRWLLMVDELPIFLMTLLRSDRGAARVKAFLNWFRELRNPADRNTDTRYICAGSIGLDAVVAQLQLGDTINDLNPIPLGAFSEETAHAFLGAIGRSYGIELNDAVRNRILLRVGWPIPFYLQVVFSKLHEHVMETAAPLTPDMVDDVVKSLLSPTYRAYFDYWRQRLTEELGRPDDARAVALLNAVAPDIDGVTTPILNQVLAKHIADPLERDPKLRFLLDVLENDGYIVKEEGRYRFRSALLREYWVARVLP